MGTVDSFYGSSSDGTSDKALIAETNDSTVVGEWEPVAKNSSAYQSEADLEHALIDTLGTQHIDYLPIHTEQDLVSNLRRQLELLNDVTFSDDEWKRFFTTAVSVPGESMLAKTERIQRHPDQVLHRDDGTDKNIRLIDKDRLPANSVQVINQYVPSGGTHKNRYDVTILVNGLPMVHVELKRRGVALREAFNQINRYQRESFWSGCGLFEYVQVFVISNGTLTKYYSNTTRRLHVEEASGKASAGGAPRSYQFTSYWADAANRPIADLADFARTFLAKRTLLAVLTRYCVLTTENDLLVMRPYQIAACERILNRIQVSENTPRMLGTRDAGGYVWHTTGSGKTLTSFKTAQLATRLTSLDKVLFVVDRRDLDYQTVREYERFQESCVSSNKSTKVLKDQLEDIDEDGTHHDYPIVVTTIQKLSTFVATNPRHPIYDKHVAIIFDECHRSQFGQMHKDITKHFRKYHLFGFTGTPIFAENRHSGGPANLSTTENLFGRCLHTYTVVDAIRDENVLKFHAEFQNTVKMAEDSRDSQVYDIDRMGITTDPQRIELVSRYILDHFDEKCRRDKSYAYGGKHVQGFNAMLATESIPAARAYYDELKKLQEGAKHPLSIAMIYSFAPNGDDQEEGFLADESFETDGLSKSDREALDEAIADYNERFGTQFDTSGNGFERYYKDLSRRMKTQEVDLAIVVDMFLTGFDSKTLNTLFVDKNLRQHGLMQAFSRTNRILNSVKVCGNIVCFRDLSRQLDDALALFGSPDDHGIVTMKTFDEYYGDYLKAAHDVLDAFPLGAPLSGEADEKAFINLWGLILRLRNILAVFDEFTPDVDPLSPRERQDYQSVYLELWEKWRPSREQATDVSDDVTFEIELAKTVDVTIDYILYLVEKKKEKGKPLDKVVVAELMSLVSSDPELRSKKELIERFLETLDATADGSAVGDEWQSYAKDMCQKELDTIVSDEGLKTPDAADFARECLRTGTVPVDGEALSKILPPMSRFTPDGKRDEIRSRVAERLKEFVRRFADIV